MTGDYLLREVYIHPMNSSVALDVLRSASGTDEHADDLIGAFYAIGISGSTQFKALTLHRAAVDNAGPVVPDSPPGILVDQLRLRAAPGPDPLADAVADCAAPLFAYEVTAVRHGATADYLKAVCDERAPILGAQGHRLVGAFGVVDDAKVMTMWACDVDAHIRLRRAYDAALGLDQADLADPRLLEWRRRAREFVVGPWREHLMAPFPGTPLAPR